MRCFGVCRGRDAPAPHVVAAAVVALPHVASDAPPPRAVPVPDAVFPHVAVAVAVAPPHVALDAVFRHAAPVSGAAPPRVARCHVRLVAALPAELLRAGAGTVCGGGRNMRLRCVWCHWRCRRMRFGGVRDSSGPCFRRRVARNGMRRFAGSGWRIWLMRGRYIGTSCFG